MPEDKAPEARKVCLHHPRRLRPFGSRDLRIFAAGEIVELETREALRLIGSNLADGVTADTKTSKGESLTAEAKTPKRAGKREATSEAAS